MTPLTLLEKSCSSCVIWYIQNPSQICLQCFEKKVRNRRNHVFFEVAIMGVNYFSLIEIFQFSTFDSKKVYLSFCHLKPCSDCYPNWNNVFVLSDSLTLETRSEYSWSYDFLGKTFAWKHLSYKKLEKLYQ